MQNLFTPFNIQLSSEQEKCFTQFLELFIETNSQINLSAIREPEAIKFKHFLDSVLPVTFLNEVNGTPRLLDIGAGGGFPCIPLCIIRPDWSIEALDSVGKKMKVVQLMADQLGISLKTHHGRIEDFGQNGKFRSQFDIVTARALAPWAVLLEYALPFVKVGGKFIAYQGPSIYEDLSAMAGLEERLGGELTNTYDMQYEFEGEIIERVFVEITKMTHTKNKYPRMNGVPRQEPLKV